MEALVPALLSHTRVDLEFGVPSFAYGVESQKHVPRREQLEVYCGMLASLAKVTGACYLSDSLCVEAFKVAFRSDFMAKNQKGPLAETKKCSSQSKCSNTKGCVSSCTMCYLGMSSQRLIRGLGLRV